MQGEQTPPKHTACAHPTQVICSQAAVGQPAPPPRPQLPKTAGQRAQLCTRQAGGLRFPNGAENAWLKGENNIATVYFPKLKWSAALCRIQFGGGNLVGPFVR